MRTIRRGWVWPAFAVCLLIPACFGPPLEILPVDLPNAVEDQSYSQSLSADDGGSYRWELKYGKLPDGLSLDEDTGRISGTPTRYGKFAFTVEVTRGGLPRRAGEQDYTIMVLKKLTLDPELDLGRQNEAYSSTPQIEGGVEPYTVTVTNLPANMQADPNTGRVYGTPLLPTERELRIEIADSGNPRQNVSGLAEFTILPPGITVATTELPDATYNEEYTDENGDSVRLEAENGREPLTWSVVAGHLPEGLLLDRDRGILSGTPDDRATTEVFTIRVSEGDDVTLPSSAEQELKIVVPVVLSSTLEAAVPEELYSEAVGVVAGLPPYTWTFDAAATPLPAGLGFVTETGLITGTPTLDATTQTISVTVTDADDPATTDTADIKLVVSVVVTNESPLPATAEGVVNVTLAAAGGTPEYTWTAAEDDVPDGLEFDPNTRVLSGTLTDGTEGATFAVTVTDSDDPPVEVTQEFTFAVTAE